MPNPWSEKESEYFEKLERAAIELAFKGPIEYDTKIRSKIEKTKLVYTKWHLLMFVVSIILTSSLMFVSLIYTKKISEAGFSLKDEASKIALSLLKGGNEPVEVIHFNEIVNGYIELNDIEKAIEVFNSRNKQKNIEALGGEFWKVTFGAKLPQGWQLLWENFIADFGKITIVWHYKNHVMITKEDEDPFKKRIEAKGKFIYLHLGNISKKSNGKEEVIPISKIKLSIVSDADRAKKKNVEETFKSDPGRLYRIIPLSDSERKEIDEKLKQHFDSKNHLAIKFSRYPV